MPSEKEEKPMGQGSSMQCPRTLCSPRNTQPHLRWPFSSLVCVFWLMLPSTFLWARRLHDRGRGGGEEAL